MKINIIGGGWYGCHLALSLIKKGYDVQIYEKNKELFSESSLNNQNRLHLGFHYPRSYKTRIQSKRGFRLFMKNYPELTKTIDLSLYAISSNNSLLDFETYKMILDSTQLSYEDVTNSLPLFVKNVDGVIDCDELTILSRKAKKFFQEKLNKYSIFNSVITVEDCLDMANDDNFVIDCTWNKIFENNNFFYEPTMILKYKNLKKINFGLTIMDGKLCSLFPFDEFSTTLSDVELTPLGMFKSAKEAYERIKKFDNDEISKRISNMETKMKKFLPGFDDYFCEPETYFSIKTKPINSLNDNRYTYLIKEKPNIFSVFAGKIDTIFDIEYSILSILENNTFMVS